MGKNIPKTQNCCDPSDRFQEIKVWNEIASYTFLAAPPESFDKAGEWSGGMEREERKRAKSTWAEPALNWDEAGGPSVRTSPAQPSTPAGRHQSPKEAVEESTMKRKKGNQLVFKVLPERKFNIFN